MHVYIISVVHSNYKCCTYRKLSRWNLKSNIALVAFFKLSLVSWKKHNVLKYLFLKVQTRNKACFERIFHLFQFYSLTFRFTSELSDTNKNIRPWETNNESDHTCLFAREKHNRSISSIPLALPPPTPKCAVKREPYTSFYSRISISDFPPSSCTKT